MSNLYAGDNFAWDINSKNEGLVAPHFNYCAGCGKPVSKSFAKEVNKDNVFIQPHKCKSCKYSYFGNKTNIVSYCLKKHKYMSIGRRTYLKCNEYERK